MAEDAVLDPPAAPAADPPAPAADPNPPAGDPPPAPAPAAGDPPPAPEDPPAEPAAPAAFDAAKLTRPDGSPLDDVEREEVAGYATALGLTQEQAQSLVTKRTEALTATSEKFLADLKADPELGGDRFDETVALATKGFDRVYPPDSKAAPLIKALLNGTGLGNHPDIVREFARIGRATQEDTHVGRTTPATERKDTAHVMFGENFK